MFKPYKKQSLKLIVLFLLALTLTACGLRTPTAVAPNGGVVVPVPASATISTSISTVPGVPTTQPTTASANAQPEFLEDRSDPATLIKSYYNAVNRKEYQRAYS